MGDQAIVKQAVSELVRKGEALPGGALGGVDPHGRRPSAPGDEPGHVAEITLQDVDARAFSTLRTGTMGLLTPNSAGRHSVSLVILP